MIKFIDLKGRKLAYRQSGEGDGVPVLLLHGFCEDSRIWEEWLPFVANQRFICIDLPGFGNSDFDRDLSIESMAADVKTLLDYLSINRCVLVGHSMGGYVGLACAGQYAEYFDGLCLFHSHPYADTEEKKAGRLKSIEFIQKNGHIHYVRQLFPGLFAYDHSNGYKMEVNKLIHHATFYSPEAIIAALEAMRRRPDRSYVLKNIACPVQFIIGKLDGAIPLDLSLAQTHLPPITDIRVYPNLGHMGMYEAQRETAKAMREFLNFASWHRLANSNLSI